MSGRSVEVVIEALDRVSAPIRKMNQAMERLGAPMRRVNSAVGALGKEAGVGKLTARFKSLGKAVDGVKTQVGGLTARLVGMAGISLGALGFGLVGGVIKTSAEFERFQTVLTTILGSSDKAKAALGWVQDFTKRTPYELAEVTEAFVKLKAYGINAQDGTLRSVGDAAAAMGRSLEQGVEALADAQTGEFERLKEFAGIRGSTKGNLVTLSFTDKEGRQRAFKAAKDDSEAIRNIVLEAFKAKGFSGAMDAMSSTWSGLVSNLKDTFAGFLKMVGDAGVFDALKGALGRVQAVIERLASNGQLQAWAASISAIMVQFASTIEAKLIAVDWGAVWQGVQDFAATIQFIVKLLGGWGDAIMFVAFIMAGPALASIGVLIGQLVALGGVLAANPVLLIMAAVAAVALLIIANWGPISRFFGGIWAGIVAAWQGAVAWFTGLWDGIKAQFNGGLGAILSLLLSFSPVVLIARAVNAVFQYFTGVSLFDAGSRFIGGLWDGIKSKWAQLTAWLSAAMAKLTGWLPDWAKAKMGITVATGSPAAPGAPPVRPTPPPGPAFTRPVPRLAAAMAPPASVTAAANPAATGQAAGVPQVSRAPAQAAASAPAAVAPRAAPVMNVNMTFNGISDVEAVKRIAREAMQTALRDWEERLRSDEQSALYG